MSGKRANKTRSWVAPRLDGKVAVVTGASRGAGRGLASVLGQAGATVYVTGRSVRGGPTTDNLPGTIEETAEEVTRRGGVGIPARCDHTVEEEVRALFERVEREQGRLDLLVNNAWGGYESPGIRPVPFWKAPLRLWEAMFVAGLRTHLLASYFAIPLMLPRRQGLIVSTVAWDHDKYLNRPNHPNWGVGTFYDIAKHAIVRMIYGLGIELRRYKIAAVAVAPGFMRTERVLQFFKAEEQNWKKFPGLKRTETPEYVGRAVAALAGDPRVLRKSGRAFHAGELARGYGFTDVDGRRVPPFTVPKMVEKLFGDYY